MRSVTNRPAGGARSKRWDRAPYDWYREPRWLADQIFEQIDLPRGTVYDPCCGIGNILDAAKAAGFDTLGSDLVRRGARHPFAIGNAARLKRLPLVPGGLSIVSNPPFNYEDGILQRIIEHLCLELYGWDRAVFIVPLAFLAAQERYVFFSRRLRPWRVWICSERPSMPPGRDVEQMGGDAFRGGMQDYCLLEYKPGRHTGPSLEFLRPRRVA